MPVTAGDHARSRADCRNHMLSALEADIIDVHETQRGMGMTRTVIEVREKCKKCPDEGRTVARH